jgi:hypothetical protein
MPNSWNIIWGNNPFNLGHGSMILAQLDAFFQLYHLTDCEYFINLSTDHYPLKSTKAIYKILQENPQSSIFSKASRADSGRTIYPFLENDDGTTMFVTTGGRHWSFKYNAVNFRTRPVKQSQWMILSRHFVHELMNNDFARILLAFSEHTFIPDEMYFITFAKSGNTNTSIIEALPTYFHFSPANDHPNILTLNQIKRIDNKSFFARKINFKDKSVMKFIDLLRIKVDEKLHIASYNNLTNILNQPDEI